MSPERQALCDRVDEAGEEVRLCMADTEMVEPDEQVRSVGQTSLMFAQWALAVTALGDWDRDHPEDV